MEYARTQEAFLRQGFNVHKGPGERVRSTAQHRDRMCPIKKPPNRGLSFKGWGWWLRGIPFAEHRPLRPLRNASDKRATAFLPAIFLRPTLLADHRD